MRLDKQVEVGIGQLDKMVRVSKKFMLGILLVAFSYLMSATAALLFAFKAWPPLFSGLLYASSWAVFIFGGYLIGKRIAIFFLRRGTK